MSSVKVRNSTLAAVLALSLPVALAPFSSLIVSPAAAQSAAEKGAVDAAKAAGQVGEQGDGFLGLVAASQDAALAAAMAAINAGRLQVYRDTAMRTGVSVEAAGQATAQQLLGRIPAGQFYKPLNGNWTRK